MKPLNAQGFDLWADGYDQSVQQSDEGNTYPFAGYRDVLARVYQTVRTYGEGPLLDIGFGTAVLTQKLYQDGYPVTGIDFSARMIALAAEKMPEATLLAHDFAQGLPQAVLDGRYQAIISTYALHHLPDAQKVALLRQLYGLLLPGGCLVIGDVAFETAEDLAGVQAASGGEWDAEESYFTYDVLSRMIDVPARYEQISICAGVLTLVKPKMVLFDFGGTLAEESEFDSLAAHKALLAKATENRSGVTAEALDAFSQKCFYDLDPTRLSHLVEIHEHPFERFINEYFGLEFDCSLAEQEMIIWDGAIKEKRATEGMPELLATLVATGIRTGVISNIMYSGQTLEQMITRLLPENQFEFIIATSEYVYRKPSPLIFELALRKAGLPAGMVWYCGDNFVCDVQGAAGVGISPIWYTCQPDGREAEVPSCTVLGDWRRLTAWMGADTIDD